MQAKRIHTLPADLPIELAITLTHRKTIEDPTLPVFGANRQPDQLRFMGFQIH